MRSLRIFILKNSIQKQALAAFSRFFNERIEAPHIPYDVLEIAPVWTLRHDVARTPENIQQAPHHKFGVNVGPQLAAFDGG